jgi:putative flippase GtrA
MLSGLLSLISKIAPIDSVFQFSRFVITGVFSALLEIGLLIFMVETIHAEYLHANVIAFLVVNICNYFMSRNWVFTSDHNKKVPEFLSYMFFVIIGLAINQLFLWIFVESINFDYKIAKLLSIGTTVIWNFTTRKHLVFKNR